jgi:hypothetical protein
MASFAPVVAPDVAPVVSKGTKQMGTEGLLLIRGPTNKLLLADSSPDGRFASDVKLWNDSVTSAQKPMKPMKPKQTPKELPSK